MFRIDQTRIFHNEKEAFRIQSHYIQLTVSLNMCYVRIHMQSYTITGRSVGTEIEVVLDWLDEIDTSVP